MNQFYGNPQLGIADKLDKIEKPDSKLKKPYKKLGLSFGKKKTGGRNNQGRITSFHRGGGNKLRYIHINKTTFAIKHRVAEFLNSQHTISSKTTRLCLPLRGSVTEPQDPRSCYWNLVQGNVSLPRYNSGEVRYLVRDPNRTSWIAGIYWSQSNILDTKKHTSNQLDNAFDKSKQLGCNTSNPWFSYYSNILAPEGLSLGSTVSGFAKKKNSEADLGTLSDRGVDSSLSVRDNKDSVQNLIATVGHRSFLKDLMVGTLVHNIDGKYIRSAGCSGIIISKLQVQRSRTPSHSYAEPKVESASLSSSLNEEFKVTVKLQSGQYKVFSGETLASVGILSNGEHKTRDYRKAGQKRWLGRRPIVRGVAMNPIDHPHGGGEGKSSGGRPSVTPWGKPTKGKPTRSPKKPKLQQS